MAFLEDHRNLAGGRHVLGQNVRSVAHRQGHFARLHLHPVGRRRRKGDDFRSDLTRRRHNQRRRDLHRPGGLLPPFPGHHALQDHARRRPAVLAGRPHQIAHQAHRSSVFCYLQMEILCAGQTQRRRVERHIHLVAHVHFRPIGAAHLNVPDHPSFVFVRGAVRAQIAAAERAAVALGVGPKCVAKGAGDRLRSYFRSHVGPRQDDADATGWTVFDRDDRLRLVDQSFVDRLQLDAVVARLVELDEPLLAGRFIGDDLARPSVADFPDALCGVFRFGSHLECSWGAAAGADAAPPPD